MGAPFKTVSRTFGFVHFDSKSPVLLKAYPPDEERDYCSQAVSVGLLLDDPGKSAQLLQELNSRRPIIIFRDPEEKKIFRTTVFLTVIMVLQRPFFFIFPENAEKQDSFCGITPIRICIFLFLRYSCRRTLQNTKKDIYGI